MRRFETGRTRKWSGYPYNACAKDDSSHALMCPVRKRTPFPRRLARVGLRALVISPLIVEGKVFGALIIARREANSFTSSDCEFMKQLSEHVGLAVHQAELNNSLRQAYDDLRQTQQAIVQQERLRALGQMASGIAHDINNAISPVSLSSPFWRRTLSVAVSPLVVEPLIWNLVPSTYFCIFLMPSCACPRPICVASIPWYMSA